MERVRMLVVDDSTLFRKVVRDVVASHPAVEVVGVASDGRQALEKIEQLQPDLITLDMQMPEMDGLEVLRAIKSRKLRAPAIMLSSFTAKGAQETLQALECGAFDFILKPNTSSLEESVALLRESLLPKIDAFRGVTIPSVKREAVEPISETCSVSRDRIAPLLSSSQTPTRRPTPLTFSMCFDSSKVLVIGVSTGGPSALVKLIPQLPADLNVPVAIVQHMPPLFTKSLADDLDRLSPLSVVEAAQGMPLKSGSVYIAPGGKQMKIAGNVIAPTLDVNDDLPVKNCRPSVDYLFRSAAAIFGAGVVACVMTGMGDDGSDGARAIKQSRGRVLAQDKDSCTVYGMPRMVIEQGLADEVVALDQLADALIRSVGYRGVVCK